MISENEKMLVKNINGTILKKAEKDGKSRKDRKKSRKILGKQNFSAKSRRGGNSDFNTITSIFIFVPDKIVVNIEYEEKYSL